MNHCGTALPSLLSEASLLLTTDEAAKLLGVSPKTVAYWRSTGDGPVFVRLGARTIRYKLEDISSYIGGRRRANDLEGC